jgi:hypothetical protein
VAAGLDDPNLLLHLVLCNSQLVTAIRAHHFLVFRRTARETFCGRRWGFVLGRCRLHNAETHVEPSYLVIHHDIGYGDHWTGSSSLSAHLLSRPTLVHSSYLLLNLHGICMSSVGAAPSRESTSHRIFMVAGSMSTLGQVVKSLVISRSLAADVLHKTADAEVAATWAIAGADPTASHSWSLGVDTW